MGAGSLVMLFDVTGSGRHNAKEEISFLKFMSDVCRTWHECLLSKNLSKTGQAEPQQVNSSTSVVIFNLQRIDSTDYR